MFVNWVGFNCGLFGSGEDWKMFVGIDGGGFDGLSSCVGGRCLCQDHVCHGISCEL